MEITPGVGRIGSGLVNVCPVEEAGEVTIIDAGMPGHGLPWTGGTAAAVAAVRAREAAASR